MNLKNEPSWNRLRTAYRPEAPALDVASIMDAVRREAAAHPLQLAKPGLAGPIPAWACTAAALLAIFAAGFVVGRSVSVADRNISNAWMQTVQPEEFTQTILTVDESADGSSL